MGSLVSKPKPSEFQKEKLVHEFETFYDLDGDGDVTWQDFLIAKEHVCKLNEWREGTDKERTCKEVFETIWETLQLVGDKDSDGRISAEEWVKLWTDLYKKVKEEKKKNDVPTVEDLPLWCYRYLLHRFHMLDRTGDGVIDQDEFEYVLSHFSVSGTDARKAWMLISEGDSRKIDFKTFTELASEYYFSNDPAALGNFITGKLDFSCIRN